MVNMYERLCYVHIIVWSMYSVREIKINNCFCTSYMYHSSFLFAVNGTGC